MGSIGSRTAQGSTCDLLSIFPMGGLWSQGDLSWCFSVPGWGGGDVGEVKSFLPFSIIFSHSVLHRGAILAHLDSKALIKVFSPVDG